MLDPSSQKQVADHQNQQQPARRGVSIRDLVELLRDYTVAKYLVPADIDECHAQGVVVATGVALGDDAAGKVVIAMGPDSAGSMELQTSAADAGVALLLMESPSAPGAKGERSTTRSARPGSARVPTLWLDQHIDWVEVIALCRAATLKGTAETAIGVPLGDIFALANSIASMTGGAVSIVDTVGRVLGYSTLPDQEIDELRRRTTLTLQEDVIPDHDSDFSDLYSTVGSVAFPASSSNSYPRVAIAARSRGEILGTVWVILRPDFNPNTVMQILTTMEPIVSQHLLSARYFGRRNTERTADLVRSVIHDPENAVAASRFLGLSLHGRRIVVRFRFPTVLTGSAVRDLHRLHHLIETHAQISFSRAVTAVVDADVISIVEVADGGTPDQVAQFSRQIVDYERQAGAGPIIVGIGEIADDLKGLNVSNLQALDVLAAIERSDRKLDEPSANSAGRNAGSAVGTFAEWRSSIGISYMAEALRNTPVWTKDLAQMVIEYDADNSTAFGETLLGFFRSMENIASTAKLLHTHHNTIRYRLRRAEQLFGLDLHDPSQRLWLWLRLEAYSLA